MNEAKYETVGASMTVLAIGVVAKTKTAVQDVLLDAYEEELREKGKAVPDREISRAEFEDIHPIRLGTTYLGLMLRAEGSEYERMREALAPEILVKSKPRLVLDR